MIKRVCNSFKKYGIINLPYVFLRWKIREIRSNKIAKNIFKLNANNFAPHTETKFKDLYIRDEDDVNRIKSGERKILFYKVNSENLNYDIKVQWEINRFHHMPIIALHHNCFNKQLMDKAFSKKELDIVFIDSNAMEVSISAINIITSYSLLNEKGKQGHKENVSLFLKESLIYILKNLEQGIQYSANHYFFNIIGILWICESVKQNGNSCLKDLASTYYIKLENLLNQFILNDGSLYEGSTFYHKYVTESLLLFIYEFDSQINIPKVKEICSRMVDFSNYASYNGKLIGIGDNDSGRILPLPTLFNYETVDLSLLNNLAILTNIYKADFQNKKLFVNKDFGLYDLNNNSWNVFIRLETGKRHYRKFIVGHCHNDQMHLTAYYKSYPFLIDTGVYSYINLENSRLNSLSTKAHNTLQVDDIEQNKIYDFARYVPMVAKYIPRNSIGKLLEHKRLSFSGKYTIKLNSNKIVHKRSVTLNDNILLIKDEVSLDSILANEIKIRFHLHPDVKVIRFDSNYIIVKCGLKLLKIKSNFESAELNILKSFYSPEYGLKIDNLCVEFAIKLDNQETIDNLIINTQLEEVYE